MPDNPPTSFLKFIDEPRPDDIARTVSQIAALIDRADSATPSEADGESRQILQELLRHLTAQQFDDVLQVGRPAFSLTPHELSWLEHHNEDIWLDYLTYRYKFTVFPALKRISDFPRHLLIEPTSICNLRCVMCFQIDESFTRDRGFMGMMPWELFTSVVDQAAYHGCHAITLASRGEPTLHKRFGEMLGYLHEKGILDVKINTNATRLPEKLIHEILSSDVSTVSFSVDASTKESYERIRVRGKFEEVLGNIELFHKIRATEYPDASTTTRISGVAMNGSGSPKEMKQFWSQYVDQVSFVTLDPRWDTYNNKLVRSTNVCPFLYERLYVWFDGICNPCDIDYKSLLSVGDATTESLTDIWTGDKFQKLRELHEARQRNSLVPCDRCPL